MTGYNDHYIHVPIPGDHYSALSGSAVMTVIYEFTRKHVEAGGRAQIILGRDTMYDYPAGEYLFVDFGGLPSRKQKMADVALARLGFPRPFINQAYLPAVKAVDRNFSGTLFIQNTPAPTQQFKRRCPKARICINLYNSLFDTYDSRELHRTIDAADMVMPNCEFLANELRSRLKHGSEKIRTVYNGVDTKRFVPRPELMPQDEVVILFVARMIPNKGADLLIEAARKIQSKKRRFKLRIVGSDGFNANTPLTPFEVELRKMAAPLGESVEFLPFMDRHHILPVYQSASIFCAPSNWDEPCTLTIPEAMSCGIPIVTSRRGGIPEIGKDAVLYFDTPNTDQLADQLAYLIDDEKARVEWGRRSRARAEEIDWAVQYRVQREVLAS